MNKSSIQIYLMVMVLMGICSGMTFGQADFRRGDVNADGFFDIGDSTYVFRYLFIGNPPPSCMDTADMNDDSTINLTDGVLGLNYLFLGGFAPEAPFPGCGPDPTSDSLSCTTYDPGLCGTQSRTTNPNYELTLSIPTLIEGSPGSTVQFEGSVLLTQADQSVFAWSLSVGSRDPNLCSIVGATTAGTVGAHVTDDPPGLRNAGFEKTELTVGTNNTGAVSAVSLSFTLPVELDPVSAPYTLLRLTFEAAIPETGSQTVEIQIVDGLQGSGQPVENIVAISNQSFSPQGIGATITLQPSSGTVISYQGRLTESGNAGKEDYDFSFRLFDTNIGGNQIGNTLALSDVPVQEGYFTVNLDFGSEVFSGEDRWLEVQVRPGDLTDPNDFTLLTPRQRLTPTPYSIHAATAGTVQVPLNLSTSSDYYVLTATNSNAKSRGILGETTAAGGVGLVGLASYTGSSAYSTGVHGESMSGSGAGVSGYAGATGAETNTGGFFEAAGDTGRGVYAEAWGSQGKGIHAKADSADAYAGYFEGRGYFSNDVGIGTTSPDAELHVNGTIRLGSGGRNFEIQEVSPADPVGWAGYIGYEGIGIGSNDGTNRQMFMFTDGADDQNIFTVATSENNSATWEADFVILQNGNIGIGTADPAYKLDVIGDLSLSKNSGALILRTPTYNDPARYSIRFQNNYIAPILGDDTQDQYFSFMTDFVKARTYSAHVRVHGQAADSWGTYLELTHDGSDGKIGTDRGDIVLEPENNVGIGTATPKEKLEVAGNTHIEGNLTWQAKTSYISVPSSAFQPEEDGYDYEHTSLGLKNLSSSSQYYRAPLQLPHGAKLITITFGWYDVSASHDAYVQLWRTENFSSGYSEGFVYSTGSAGHAQSSLDLSGDNLVVDNSQNTYDLRCYLPDSDFRLKGVIIEYTFTETY